MRLKTLVLVGALALKPSPARAEPDNTKPILAFAPSLDLAPLLDEALWDASIAPDADDGASGAKALRTKLQKLEKSVAKAPKPKDLRALFEAYVLLARVEREGKNAAAKEAIATARRSVVTWADRYTTKAESKYLKARAIYHGQVARYFLAEEPVDAAALAAVVKDLSPELAAEANLILALLEVDKLRGPDLTAAAGRLVALAAVLSPPGRAAAQLIRARALMGVDAAGAIVSPRRPESRDALAQATDAGVALPPALKRTSLSVAAAIWQAAGGATTRWADFPCKLDSFAEMPDVLAIKERVAMGEAGAGHYDAAVRLYAEVRKGAGQAATAARIDARVIDLRRDEAAATRDSTAYEQALTATLDKYRKPDALGPKGKALVGPLREGFARQYVKLATEVSAAALLADATPATRKRAALMLAVLPRVTEDAQVKDLAKNRLAGIAAASGDLKSASQGFLALALANGTPPEKKRGYLDLALAAQRQLTKWPKTDPFAMLRQGVDLEPAELARLLELYKLVLNLPAKALDWDATAHVGVLQMMLGKSGDAAKLWNEALKKDATSPEAAVAAGYLMTTALEAKAWTELEARARLVTAAKIQPTWSGKPVDVRLHLGAALLGGGDLDLAQKRYADAARRLAEYGKDFAEQPRQDEALLKLALALRQSGKYLAALDVLALVAKRYPVSPLSPKALHNAGDDALRLGLEDRAAAYYEDFLKAFAKDAEAPAVQSALVRLYLASRSYDKAVALLKSMLEPGRLAGKALVEAGRKLIEIEGRSGDLDRVVAAAAFFAKAAPTEPAAEIQLQLTTARKVSTKRNFEKIAEIEAALAKMPARGADWEEALGEVRFMMAESLGGAFVLAVNSGALASPVQTLRPHYAFFKDTFASYMRVCVGKASYCAPALFRASSLATQFLAAYRTARLPRSLDAKTGAAFKKTLADVQSGVARMRSDAERGAVLQMAGAYTDPNWAHEILSVPPATGWRSWLAYDRPRFYLQLDQKTFLAPGAPPTPKAKAAKKLTVSK